ncbi:MAG: thiol peroxidase [Bacteroidales bacterium]|nr:thiol peroxidase [Bacteroidales bacterium]MDE7073044.1 thiol peroxidase [Bacteroidales bacterium]
MQENKGVITMQGNPLTLEGTMVQKGDTAQDFTVLAPDLSPVKLSDYKGKVRIISVVPSIDTSVCDTQTRQFNKEAASHPGVEILTVSCDLPFALGRFCGAAGIDKVHVCSDHRELDFGHKYGFVIKELRLLSRGIVVVDKDDKVAYVEYVKEVTQLPDFEKALEVVENLK